MDNKQCDANWCYCGHCSDIAEEGTGLGLFDTILGAIALSLLFGVGED